MDVVWQHSECGYYIDGPERPMECPAKDIQRCPDPLEGFDQRCTDPEIWKCRACGWLVASDTMPERCPAGPELPNCPNPRGGTYNKICE